MLFFILFMVRSLLARENKYIIFKVVPYLLIHFHTILLLLSFFSLKTFLIVKTKRKARCSSKCISTLSALSLALFANSDLKTVVKVDTVNDNCFYFYIISQSLKHKFSHLKYSVSSQILCRN